MTAGKSLKPIASETYREVLKSTDVYVVRKEPGKAETNKGFANVDKVIVVGMDQWVITDTAKGAALCSSGIIGCIGLALIGGSRAAGTHLLDGFEAEATWPTFQVKLAEMIEVMGRVDGAWIVSSSSIYVDKCELVAAFLEKNGIPKGHQIQQVSGGFALRATTSNNWTFTIVDKPLTLFKEVTAITVTKSDLHNVKRGTLSAKAADSGG